MGDDLEKYSHSGWGSMKSVSTASHFNPEEYPLLAELAEFLVQLQSVNTYEDNVEALASGTILCNIFADSINSDEIGGYHHDAKASSELAEENFSVLRRACHSIQIPDACIVTVKNFENGDYDLIELMLVMFTIRGMAYGLTDVPEDLERKLREYEIKDISLPRRDLRVCQNILNVFRLQNNNKDIPVVEPISDTSSESGLDRIDDSSSSQIDGEELDLNKLPNASFHETRPVDMKSLSAISDDGSSTSSEEPQQRDAINRAALPEPIPSGTNPDLRPEDKQSNDDDHSRHLPEDVEPGKDRTLQPDSLGGSAVQGSTTTPGYDSLKHGERQPGVIIRDARPDDMNSSMKSQSAISDGSSSTSSEEPQQRDAINRAALPEELTHSMNSKPISGSGHSGNGINRNALPEEVIPSDTNPALKPEDKQSDDDDHSRHLPEDVEPMSPPSGDSVDPFQHLRIPWDPMNNWKPLPIDDEEFETEKDCPFPFEWDDPSPLTLDDRIQRMVEVLRPEPKPEPEPQPQPQPQPKPEPPTPSPVPTPVPGPHPSVIDEHPPKPNPRSKPPYDEIITGPRFGLFPAPKFESRKPSPYIIALFVVLMLCCVAGFITCGVLLAKIN